MEHMVENIGGLSHVEYLIVFNTIIFGVVATEYFTAWGSMLRHRGTVKAYWLHLVWSVFSFILILQNWYGIWPRTEFVNKHIGYFIWSLVPMFIYHLISVALFPSMRSGKKIDLKEYFFDNARVLFILFAIYFLLAISSSFVYVDQGNVLVQNLLRGLGVVLSILGAIFYRKLIFHVLLLVFGIGGLIVFITQIPT